MGEWKLRCRPAGGKGPGGGWTISPAAGALAAGRWYVADLLRGPHLAPTPPGLSLKDEFPPPAGWTEAAVAPVVRVCRVEDVVYTEGDVSVFPAYRFWMTARDLARFGLLYLDRGWWGDREVVPSAWVAESLTRHSDAGDGVGYGYMWWIMPDRSYLATGTGGQKIRLYPEQRLVIVNQVNTGRGFRRTLWWFWGRRVNNSDISGLRRRLEAALPAVVGLEAATPRPAP